MSLKGTSIKNVAAKLVDCIWPTDGSSAQVYQKGITDLGLKLEFGEGIKLDVLMGVR